MIERMIQALESKNIDICYALNEQGIMHIVIYGFGRNGRLFLNFIQNTKIVVECIIDKKVYGNFSDYSVTNNLSAIPANTDAIIVTPERDMEDIISSLRNQTDIQVISLLDILRELLLCPLRYEE